MQFVVRELAAFELRYIDEYKKKFVLPLDTEKNKGMTVEVKWEDTLDCNETITSMCDLAGMSRLALVIFDLDELFDKEAEEIPSPYGFSAFAPITRNVMLSKEGRAIARCIDAEMIKRHYTRLITMHPEEYVYVMLHSGLVY